MIVLLLAVFTDHTSAFHPTTYCSLSQSMHVMYLVEVHRFEVTRVTVARAASSQVCSINVSFEDIARERKKKIVQNVLFRGTGWVIQRPVDHTPVWGSSW
jgi:hypothetical protein